VRSIPIKFANLIKNAIFSIFSGLECVGHSFALCFLRDVLLRNQTAVASASGRATATARQSPSNNLSLFLFLK
jgi:hypothetical protein